MPENKLPDKVILYKSKSAHQPILKKYLNQWQIQIIEAEYFAQIPNPQIIEKTPCALAIIEDQKAIEFLRATMHYFTWTQRVMLSEHSDIELVKTAINRAHVNYFLELPLVKEELYSYLIKANRRFRNVVTPIHKFQILTNVTADLLEDNLRFKEEAQTDPLTRLLNRRSFNLYLENFWHAFLKKEQPFALAMLDIDHFKKINDTFGHPIGDVVLKKFAQLLLTNLRSQQDFAFRVGGEEFALLSYELTKEKMAQYVERILKLVRDLKVSVKQKQISFTFSAGVADIVKYSGPQELIKKADDALYKAKQIGRNRVVIASD